jgi:hypothetical protein
VVGSGGDFEMKQFTFDFPFPDPINARATIEKVFIPPQKQYSPGVKPKSMKNEDFVRQTIQEMEPGVVYSTRLVDNFPAIDFATSSDEWWNAKSGENAKISRRKLLDEMERQKLKKVTLTIVGFGKMPGTRWPFEESRDSINQTKWDEMKGITIRLWYLSIPNGKVDINNLASQCKDRVFSLSPSQLSAPQHPSFAVSLHAATTDITDYEKLSDSLNDAGSSEN